ncbi:MAG: hypothetical protein EYC62_06050 [Alphaproteobacteria bacterium]|nr:MAG: hypothetical protein EYC62_06050 [Alphaproteobacteria bacterium]
MTQQHYSFIAPGAFMGIRPLFLPEASVTANSAFQNFISRRLPELRQAGMNLSGRAAAIDAELESLRAQLTPRLTHHYQLVNQAHHIDLKIGDRSHEIELWWPKNPPNSGPDNFAKPCCGVFLIRGDDGHMQLRVGYQPGVLLIDVNNPAIPAALAVHTVKRQLLTQKIQSVHINIYGDPAENNSISGQAKIIRAESPDQNTELDEPLIYIRDAFASGAGSIDAEGLAGLLEIGGIGAISIALRQRGGR